MATTPKALDLNDEARRAYVPAPHHRDIVRADGDDSREAGEQDAGDQSDIVRHAAAVMSASSRLAAADDDDVEDEEDDEADESDEDDDADDDGDDGDDEDEEDEDEDDDEDDEDDEDEEDDAVTEDAAGTEVEDVAAEAPARGRR